MLVHMQDGTSLAVEFKHELHLAPNLSKTPFTVGQADPKLGISASDVLKAAKHIKREGEAREKRHRRTVCRISFAEQVDGQKNGQPAKIWKTNDSPLMETQFTAPQFETQTREDVRHKRNTKDGEHLKGDAVKGTNGEPLKLHRKYKFTYPKEVARRTTFEEAMSKLRGTESDPGLLFSRKKDRAALWDAFFKGRKAQAQQNLDDAVAEITGKGISKDELRAFCKKHAKSLVRGKHGEVDCYKRPAPKNTAKKSQISPEAMEELKSGLMGALMSALGSRGGGGNARLMGLGLLPPGMPSPALSSSM